MYNLPTHISRYEIKSRIGRGGMGDLYLALDPNTGRLVALKLLNTSLDSIELRERFAREARALAALNHTNIVNIYDTGEFDDSPFIVMEYVRGETLAEMIKRRAPLSISQKLKLMEDLCAGLAQAHEAGIIHRDIKPANLMVDQQGRLKILDFGIARVAEGHKTQAGGPLTQVNMMIGTPGYMSPEQIEGGEVDHRSDIFAVGAVCYELLSYDEAFAGTNTRQIEMQVLRGKPKPLASLGLDPEIDEIVLRALKTDPNKRYQDAATFERALARLRARLGPDSQGPHRLTPPPPQNQRGMSREVRAEAAYQRALLSYEGGSPDAARRSAVEAIAEDPSHTGARELLARLDNRRVPIGPIAPAAGSATEMAAPFGESGGTLASSSTLASSGTMVSSGTMASSSTIASSDTHASAPPLSPTRGMPASAPTILVSPPKARKPGVVKRFQGLVDNLRTSVQTRVQPAPRGRAAFKPRQPFWQRYPAAVMIGAALVGVVAIVGLVLLVMSWVVPSGQVLTISRPVGGTVFANGITCGSGGNNCSTQIKKGEPIDLRAEADKGYNFISYTGDCAPSGRTTMTAARTCGATFEPEPVAPDAPAVGGAVQVLTINPVPQGGTIEAVGIKCGTNGSACSTNVPNNEVVILHANPDDKYTFMGFRGDCAPTGQMQMAGARTCSALFQLTSTIPSAPPVVRGNPTGTTPRGGTGSTVGGGTVAGTGTGTNPGSDARPGTKAPSSDPLPAPPPRGGGATAAPPDPKDVSKPLSDDDDAKMRVQARLLDFCNAHEAIDPDAVIRMFPKTDVESWHRQLTRSKYKSVQCKFGEPKFLSVDGAGGRVKVEAELKRVYDHTVTGIMVSEMIATMTFSRANRQSPWFMDEMIVKPKPKS